MSAERETISFPVRGMVCTSCVNQITRALRTVKGVDGVRVDLGREVAIVRRHRASASDGLLEAAVARAGYAADLGSATPVSESELRGALAGLLWRWARTNG